MSKGGSGNYGTDHGFGRGIGASSGDEVTWPDYLQDQRSIQDELQLGREFTELAKQRPSTVNLEELANQAGNGEI